MLMPGTGWRWQQCPWQEHPSQAGRGAAQGSGGVLAPLRAAAGGAQGLLGGQGARGAEQSGPRRLRGLPACPATPLPPAWCVEMLAPMTFVATLSPALGKYWQRGDDSIVRFADGNLGV